MRLCKPSYEIWEQPAGLEGIYKMIEKAAKVCYKSEGNITEDSAKPFIDKVLMKRGHLSPLEHGTVYLAIPHINDIEVDNAFTTPFDHNPYSRVTKYNGIAYITTNYRTIIENKWEDWLKYLCEPTEYHAKRIIVKFICDRGVSHEFVRHRVFSFAQESTRYCNYSNKEKFDNEITFIIPCWLDIPEGHYGLGKLRRIDNPEQTCMVEVSENNEAYDVESPIGKFLHVLDYSSDRYMELINEGWKPQQARTVLPNALKTELVMTGFADDWKHFFFLRCPINAHPQARELAIPLSDEFNRRGFLE